MTIRQLDDFYDELTLVPGASVEANEVQLVAWTAAFLDEANAVRIGIFTAGSADRRLLAARSRRAL